MNRGYTEADISRDLGFIIQELKAEEEEKEKLAKEVFEKKLECGEIKFYLVSGLANCSIPERIKQEPEYVINDFNRGLTRSYAF